jgi:hypothetical protein
MRTAFITKSIERRKMNKAIQFEKLVTVHEDITCYGNRFWIQVEDSECEDNKDLKEMIGKKYVAQLTFLIEGEFPKQMEDVERCRHDVWMGDLCYKCDEEQK